MSDVLTADVVVIGMGPGGEDVAGRLAAAGLDVVGVDRSLVGGECPYWGCVPSKMMIRAADLIAEAHRIPGLAGDVTVRPDWAPVAQRIRDEATDDWDDTVAVERFESKGGRFLRGEGRIVAPGRVAVGDQVVEARRGIVLATGTRPSVPPIPGLSDVPFWTNHGAIEAKEVPRSLIVLGGGTIGVELAQVFARFGADVTVLEAADRLVDTEEPEASEVLADVFSAESIGVRTAAEVSSVRRDGDDVAVELEGGDPVRASQLLVATGRDVDLGAVGVEAVGVDPSLESVPVDDHLRVVGAEDVWAVGDVTGAGPFTHVALHQSPIAVADILGEQHVGSDERAVPRVTFTDPEIGAVGLTESQARDAGITVRVGVARVPKTARGWIHKAGNDGVIKLVEDASRGVLVGGTTMGPAGGEVLGALTVAVHARVPTDQLRTMIYAYPTFHRGIEDALRHMED
jgi:pyruvate/2-oxoglutarate dehydrogenase complex dihydrolipoamide dehydrogenase (E3) component